MKPMDTRRAACCASAGIAAGDISILGGSPSIALAPRCIYAEIKEQTRPSHGKHVRERRRLYPGGASCARSRFSACVQHERATQRARRVSVTIGLGVRPRTKSPGLVLGPERDDDIGRLGLMGLELVRIGVAPVGHIDDRRRLPSIRSRLRLLHDIESVAVEEESVLPEQSIELRHDRMVLGNGLALELSESSLNLCRSQFHSTSCFGWRSRHKRNARRGASPTSKWFIAAVISVIPRRSRKGFARAVNDNDKASRRPQAARRLVSATRT